MPSGKTAEPVIIDNLDSTVTVQYSPSEAGLHEMHIKYNGTHIPGEHSAVIIELLYSHGCKALTLPLQKSIEKKLLVYCSLLWSVWSAG